MVIMFTMIHGGNMTERYTIEGTLVIDTHEFNMIIRVMECPIEASIVANLLNLGQAFKEGLEGTYN